MKTMGEHENSSEGIICKKCKEKIDEKERKDFLDKVAELPIGPKKESALIRSVKKDFNAKILCFNCRYKMIRKIVKVASFCSIISIIVDIVLMIYAINMFSPFPFPFSLFWLVFLGFLVFIDYFMPYGVRYLLIEGKKLKKYEELFNIT
jgi:uncharacterized protein YhhL (DUF1145 family)